MRASDNVQPTAPESHKPATYGLFLVQRESIGPSHIRRWKHSHIVRSRIERDIKPAIGSLALSEVRPSHLDALLKGTTGKRGVATTATDVLR